MRSERNLIHAGVRLKWITAVIAAAALWIGPRAARAERDTTRVPVTLLSASIGAFAGGGTALLIYDPFEAHRREIRENPEHMSPPIVYCLPHAGATAGGFLVGIGVGLLLPATLATQIVELAVLAAVMLTDFYIVHVLRQPVDEEPEGPPMWPEHSSPVAPPTLRLEVRF